MDKQANPANENKTSLGKRNKSESVLEGSADIDEQTRKIQKVTFKHSG